ncbi:hypothetical protein R6Q57_013432 [Mikania cordata]
MAGGLQRRPTLEMPGAAMTGAETPAGNLDRGSIFRGKGVDLNLDMMDVTWLSAILVGVGCLALGFFIGARKPGFKILPSKTVKNAALVDGNRKGWTKLPLEIEKLAEIIEDFKMVLVVRNDLKMGKGKIAAQCSHATLGLYKKILHRAPKALSRWEMCGQVKVVVKIESEDDMLELQRRAKSLAIPTHIVIDAGRTQIAPNSRTVMAVLGKLILFCRIYLQKCFTHAGPADMVDDVTGGLKLL